MRRPRPRRRVRVLPKALTWGPSAPALSPRPPAPGLGLCGDRGLYVCGDRGLCVWGQGAVCVGTGGCGLLPAQLCPLWRLWGDGAPNTLCVAPPELPPPGNPPGAGAALGSRRLLLRPGSPVPVGQGDPTGPCGAGGPGDSVPGQKWQHGAGEESPTKRVPPAMRRMWQWWHKGASVRLLRFLSYSRRTGSAWHAR